MLLYTVLQQHKSLLLVRSPNYQDGDITLHTTLASSSFSTLGNRSTHPSSEVWRVENYGLFRALMTSSEARLVFYRLYQEECATIMDKYGTSLGSIEAFHLTGLFTRSETTQIINRRNVYLSW
jgi:hypothetical protein